MKSCRSAQAKAQKSAEQRRTRCLREDISKLAALVDHYYTAFQESHILLERRDRELAELRRGLSSPGRRPTDGQPAASHRSNVRLRSAR